MYSLVFLDEALQELEEHIDWYEDKQVGLGEQLAENAQIALQKLIRAPYLFGIGSTF